MYVSVQKYIFYPKSIRSPFSRAAFTASSSRTCTGLFPKRHPSKLPVTIAASTFALGCRRTAEPSVRLQTNSTRRVSKPKLAKKKHLREEVCYAVRSKNAISMLVATEICSPMELWYFVVDVDLLSNLL